jgi:hypothetical protein
MPSWCLIRVINQLQGAVFPRAVGPQAAPRNKICSQSKRSCNEKLVRLVLGIAVVGGHNVSIPNWPHANLNYQAAP